MLDSIEIDEGMYPFIVETRKVAVDSLGPGRWNGAPGMTGTFWPLADEMLVIYCSDGCVNPPKGVLGGSAGGAARNMKRLKNGETVDLPGFHEELVQPGEAIIFVNNGGGGYGDPATREPTLVARDVNRGWLSLERAQVVYRVALVQAQTVLSTRSICRVPKHSGLPLPAPYPMRWVYELQRLHRHRRHVHRLRRRRAGRRGTHFQGTLDAGRVRAGIHGGAGTRGRALWA